MFNGFSENTIEFLSRLGQNNNKAWFEENRQDYEEYVINKFKALVNELGPYMLEIDPFLEIKPNKCISRIYRDIRFSKNKAPYRNNLWISFKRANRDWKTEPTYYFELFTYGYRFGMGFYDMPREIMDKLREKIVEEDKDFVKMTKAFKKQKVFRLEGECYKRTLNENILPEYKEWYQRKEIYFVADRVIDEVLFSNDLVEELMINFKLLLPIYDYFLKLIGRQGREDF